MWIDRLPDAYRKDENSNNYKLLQLPEEQMNALRARISEVELQTDILHADSTALDLFGEMLGKKRGNLGDEKYKYLLLTQIGKNIINGDFNNTLDTIIAMFSLYPDDISYEDIKIIESEISGDIEVIKLPLRVLFRAGFTVEQALELIRSILPIGVGIRTVILEGSFEFGTAEGEYDTAKGFGDLHDETIGGMLGTTIKPAEERVEFAANEGQRDIRRGLGDTFNELIGGILG